MATRTCCGCRQVLAKDEFTRNQWRMGVGVSRCKLCVTEGAARTGEGVGTARTNLSASKVVFGDLARPFAQGAFRYVCEGIYAGGFRTGQKCVAKYFKGEAVIEASYFNSELAVIDKTLEVLEAYNAAGFITDKIRLNMPEVWRFKPNMGPSAAARAGQLFLLEPYLSDFKKFNSNTGWVARDGGAWCDVMQAVSHFSYHHSRGAVLLCDLQGGVYRDGAILGDPVIMSQARDGTYGPTDLGPQGISTFFSAHRCNRFCMAAWTRPADQRQYLAIQSGSSMEHYSTPSDTARRLLGGRSCVGGGGAARLGIGQAGGPGGRGALFGGGIVEEELDDEDDSEDDYY